MRSGHGRVIYCYFELCEKVWGGGGVVQQLSKWIQVWKQLNRMTSPVERVIMMRTRNEGEGTQPQASTNSEAVATQQPTSSGSQPATAAQQTISQIGRKQREQLNSTLSTYKQQK